MSKATKSLSPADKALLQALLSRHMPHCWLLLLPAGPGQVLASAVLQVQQAKAQ
jgi:hypothetical protein